MTTDVTTRNNTLPAQADAVGMTGEVDASDFAIPYVSLVQASSEAVKQRKAMAGIFQSTDGEQMEHVDFVPLHIRLVRDFYDKEAQKSICGSNDRVTGYPRDLSFFRTHGNLDVTEGIPVACKDCPFYDTPAGPKLACLKGYVVTCYDLEREQPFMYRVRGTAISPFKNRFIGAVAMGRTKPWARAFQMTAVLKSSGGNSWFVPELEPTKGYTAEEQAEWESYAGQYGSPMHVDQADDLPFE